MYITIPPLAFDVLEHCEYCLNCKNDFHIALDQGITPKDFFVSIVQNCPNYKQKDHE